MVTLDVLASAPLTIEMLVAHDIAAYSRRRAAGPRAPRRPVPGGYSGITGVDPAITGEPPEEQVARSRAPQ